MNKSFLTGFCIGAVLSGTVTGVGSYLYFKKKADDTIRAEADRYITARKELVEQNSREKEQLMKELLPSNEDLEASNREVEEITEMYRAHSELTSLSHAEEGLELEPVDDNSDAYVIDSDEFGELDGYSTISLYYYNDGVLTEILAGGVEEVVDNATDVVGTEWVNHIGEYSDDAVYVRNDARLCDYEIIVCENDFDPSSVIGTPYGTVN